MNFDFDVKSAWLRLAQQDQAQFMTRICLVLQESMPSRVTIAYERKKLFGPKEIQSVGVKFGEEELKVTIGVDMPKFSLLSVERKPDPLFAVNIPAPAMMGLLTKVVGEKKHKPAVALTSRIGGLEASKEGMTLNIGGQTKLAVVETTMKASDWMEKLIQAVSEQSDLAKDFLRSMQKI